MQWFLLKVTSLVYLVPSVFLLAPVLLSTINIESHGLTKLPLFLGASHFCLISVKVYLLRYGNSRVLRFRIWDVYVQQTPLSVTFKTGALLPPVDIKATQRAEFTAGKVIVTRCGGGLGESLIGATIFLVSWIWGAPKGNN